jgi:CRISPR-associated endonuclease Csn1
MTKILGLDLGTNSIGWAILDFQTQKIIDTGVYIFPEGVNRDTKGAEISKNETRRNKRQARRQYFRTRIRKAKLVQVLIDNKMFPDISTLFDSYHVNGHHRFTHKLFKMLQEPVLCDELKYFFSLDPYQLRKEALERELTNFEIGRIIYQLSQRRGYKESLQTPLEDGKSIMTGDKETGKTGIEATQELIHKYGTLGAGLASLNTHQERIRNRYTLRTMYLDEFNKIWEFQSKFKPQVLTNDLKNQLGDPKVGILFFQRPLRNQKYLIGNCNLEKNKPRCRQSTICFEQFRMYQFINTIRIDGIKLNEEQKIKIANLFNSKEKFNFSQIEKVLNAEGQNFNYESEQKIIGNKTIISFRKIFGKNEWDSFSDDVKEHIWQIKINADDKVKTANYLKSKWNLNDKQIENFLKTNLVNDYAQFSKKAIDNILPYLKKGYLYNEAVILGGIKKAFGHEVWNRLPETEKNFIEDNVSGLMVTIKGSKMIDNIKEFLKETYGLNEKYLNKLYHHSQLNNGETTGKFPESDSPISSIRNPVVTAALFAIRKLVTELIDEYGNFDEIKVEMARELKSSFKERQDIRFDNMKNEKINDEAKKILDDYGQLHTRINIQKVLLFKEIAKENGIAVNPFNPEQTFKISDLFKHGYVQVEHITPYSVCLNDSFSNKTLCDADTNRNKGDRTPFQYYKAIGGDWEKIKQSIFKILPYNKAKRFISEVNPDIEEFLSRQLNDTRYISRYAKEYLKNVCQNVSITQGGVSAHLRHLWGLNTILSPSYVVENVKDGEYFAAVDLNNKLIEDSFRKWEWSENDKLNKSLKEELKKIGKVVQGIVFKNRFVPKSKKERIDHRHHAVDAIAIAATKQSYLQKISTLTGRGTEEEYVRQLAEFPEPWAGFQSEARDRINNIIVSFRKNNRVLTKSRKLILSKITGKPETKEGKKIFGQGIAARGELHEATYLGKRKAPKLLEAFHIRKRLEDLTPAMINRIVDDRVRFYVMEAIRKKAPEIDFTKKYILPDKCFFETDENGYKHPLVFLPNKNGSPIPIKKARIRDNKSNAIQLKDYNVWVEPGKNHHIVLYMKDGEIREEVISFWTACERLKQKEPLFKVPPEADNIVAFLKQGDYYLLGTNNEELNWSDRKYLSKHLYRIQKLSYGYYTFRKLEAATLQFDIELINIQSEKRWFELNPIQVNISTTGKIIRVNAETQLVL